MKQRKFFQALVIASSLALSACGGGNADVKEKLGLKVPPPDEFSVVTRAPLAVPPDYTLRPPRPGAERPNELSVREEARKTVFGVSDVQTTTRTTTTESASGDFMNKLGATQSDPNIRESLNTEIRAMDKKEQPVAERMLFWKEKEVPGKTIDPVEEQKRLQASGQVQAATPAADDANAGTTTVKKRNEDILQTP